MGFLLGIISIGLCVFGFWIFGVPLFLIAVYIWVNTDNSDITAGDWEQAMRNLRD